MPHVTITPMITVNLLLFSSSMKVQRQRHDGGFFAVQQIRGYPARALLHVGDHGQRKLTNCSKCTMAC